MKIAAAASSVLFLLALGWLTSPSAAIYPPDHWSYSTEITSDEQFHSVVQDTINDADRTLLGNTKQLVSFADINLAKVPTIRGEPHNPGAGGWPTIRYFNRATGPNGAGYVLKTSKAVCEELGDEESLIQYVEEASTTFLCSVVDGTGCDERSLIYLEKQKALGVVAQEAQLVRLEGMAHKEMKEDLKVWLKKRMRILRQLIAQAKAAEEL